nr:hypothetical protein [uncultured Dyadobacter sp.]
MLDIEIDKLTNSIEHALTGRIFETEVVLVEKISRRPFTKTDWLFDWHGEVSHVGKCVYKLVIRGDPKRIHGLISVSFNEDHVFMHLIENAKFNKGRTKEYLGVAGNLIAYACRLAFEKGFDGIVVFESKTSLITYYQKAIGAKILGGRRMFIDSKESFSLFKQYFK